MQFDSYPVYGDNEKYIKTKIRMYVERFITNFQGKKAPKENASYYCIALVSVDCVIKMNNSRFTHILYMGRKIL